MDTVLATKCALTVRGSDNDAIEYSEAIELHDTNAVEYEVVVVNLQLDEDKFLHVEVEESNDLENWDLATASSSSIAVIGATYKKVTGLSSTWTRLKYTLDSPFAAQATNRAAFATRVWTSDQ